MTTPPPQRPQPTPADPAAPLTPEHLDQITEATLSARKIRKAGGLAMVNACIMAFCAAGSFLFAGVSGLFGEVDVIGLIMTAGLALLAWNEFRGRTMLRRFDVRACRVLGWNQLGLMALVVGYSAWMLGSALWGPGPYAEAAAQQPEIAGPLNSIDGLYKSISAAIYGALIVGTVLFQGLNALYYFRRRKLIEAYLHQTPPWILQLQQRGG